MDLPGPYWQVPAHTHPGPLRRAGTSLPRRPQPGRPAPGEKSNILFYLDLFLVKFNLIFVCPVPKMKNEVRLQFLGSGSF
jgi:hypothetical protein